MKPVSPVIVSADAEEIIYGANQPEVQPLPAIRTKEGIILTRWLLTENEKKIILEQGYVFLSVSTCNQPLQPVMLTADVPTEFAEISKPLEEEWPEEFEEKI